MLTAVWNELQSLRCVLLHWNRQRDSYGNRCTACGRYWR